MSTDEKFTATALVLLSIPIVFRLAPVAAILMLLGLLALAYVAVNDSQD